MDVQLDRDDKTIVQPNVIIVCDRNKMYKYTHAGVREYWIVDLEKKTVVAYDLEHKAPPVLYGFSDRVPVLVWDSRCQVDFAEIQELFGFLDK